MNKPLPAGWIWSVLLAAEDAADDIRQLCTDHHPADGYCSFCRSRLRIRRGLKRAQAQLLAIQVHMDKEVKA